MWIARTGPRLAAPARPAPLHVPPHLRVLPALLHAAPLPAAVLAAVEEEPAASGAALEAVERTVAEQLDRRVGERSQGGAEGVAGLPVPAVRAVAARRQSCGLQRPAGVLLDPGDSLYRGPPRLSQRAQHHVPLLALLDGLAQHAVGLLRIGGRRPRETLGRGLVEQLHAHAPGEQIAIRAQELVVRLRRQLVAAGHRVHEVEREVPAVEAQACYVRRCFQQN